MTTRAVCVIAVSLFLAIPAHGDTIGRLADGAYCRDEKGVVRQPFARPSPRAEVQRVPQGMVKTLQNVTGAACFLYLREVALTELPGGCDSAETASGKRNVSGTLGSCSER